MERRPEHLKEDPILREEFVAQESWDEYIERKIAEIEEKNLEMAQGLREDTSHSHPVYQYWNYLWQTEVLDPVTNVDEVFYLAGFTEVGRRTAAIDQRHATLREAAQAKGLFEIPTVGGIEGFELKGE